MGDVRTVRVHFPNEHPVALRWSSLSSIRLAVSGGGGTDEDLGDDGWWFFLGFCVDCYCLEAGRSWAKGVFLGIIVSRHWRVLPDYTSITKEGRVATLR